MHLPKESKDNSSSIELNPPESDLPQDIFNPSKMESNNICFLCLKALKEEDECFSCTKCGYSLALLDT